MLKDPANPRDQSFAERRSASSYTPWNGRYRQFAASRANLTPIARGTLIASFAFSPLPHDCALPQSSLQTAENVN